jgi:hypothetical protein
MVREKPMESDQVAEIIMAKTTDGTGFHGQVP